MANRFLSRVRILTLLCALAALVIIGRLYILQVMHGENYAARASAQFTDPSSPLLDRGTIYFTNKDGGYITAASIKNGYAIAVNPAKVTDPEALYAAVNAVVPLDRADFLAKATKAGSQYQLLAQHLSDDAGLALQAKNLPGLIIESDRWRFYPGGSLAAQTLGFVAYQGDAQNGRYGLERQYDDVLARPNEDLYANFFVELFGGVKSVLQGTPQEGDIITTIEPSVEQELERQLASYVATWHPKLAGGIVMDPQTGAIVAMGVSPTFDLNSFNTQTDPLIYANPMVQNVYEMGSIVKPLTMAAALDSGAVTENETYDDVGCVTVDQSTFCNYDQRARGIIPMQQILSQSLNVGAAFLAGQMGPDTMRDYFLNHYKLGDRTGIDLPGEVKGIVNNLQSTRHIEYDTASFGQGIAITPIETARALSVLANGGYLVEPHVVSAIRYTTGVTRAVPIPAKVQVLKPETATTISRMLTTVVDTALANGHDKLDHWSVAAKTGTAQIADPVNGGYYSNRYLHSFFGYFPSYNARFVVFLFAVEPVGAPYASETWAPPWHALTQFLINYYNVPPDR